MLAAGSAARFGKLGDVVRESVLQVLRVGVVGAGVFGNYHAQKAAASRRTCLSGVYDICAERRQRVCDAYGAPSSNSLADLIERSDAIIVATPASMHEAIVYSALRAGLHVLVEKPLAMDAIVARELADFARDAGLVLQVGHQERFVARAMGVFAIEEAPLLLESVRAAPPAPNGRAEDVSVIWDLMIHDLDLAACLIGRDVSGVRASGARRHTDKLDEAEAEFTFPSGARARLVASRAAPSRERTMRLVYPSGVISVDFLTRRIVNTTPYAVEVDVSAQLPDPLGAADEGFFAACLGEKLSPVPAHGVVAAVAMAERVEADALAELRDDRMAKPAEA